MTHLNQLSPGHRARITAITGSGPVYRRLLDMGMTPGSVVEMERSAPLGDPIAIRVKGYRLSLRLAEAATVAVEAW